MKKTVLASVLIFTFAIISFAQNSPRKVTNSAPEFKAISLDNDSLDLEKLKGNIVVINIWGTWCAPCVEEIPALNKLATKYKDQAVFIAITAEGAEKIESYLSKKPFHYKHITNRIDLTQAYSKAKLKDFNKGFMGKMSVWPIHVIINKNGEISYYQKGGSTNIDELLEPYISKLLN
jgi:thiol-disulfide isomerase/thioredoxin